MAVGPQWVEFLQLVQTGSSVSGTETWYEYTGSATPNTGTSLVSGFVEGSTVQLTIGSGVYTGVLAADGSVTLAIPQPDGIIGNATFIIHTISDYNSMVASLQPETEEWSAEYWGTQASLACILTVGSHDVRIFVAAGPAGSQACSTAVSLGYTTTTNYFQQEPIVCVGGALPVNGHSVSVAVGDDGTQAFASNFCPEVNAFTFPTAPAPSY
jgi:hypothetical protein